MKLNFALFLMMVLGLNTAKAQDFPKVDVSTMDAVIVRTDDAQSFMRIIYSRPQKKGRDVFGKLVPYGKVWRTGANEATEITFYKDVMFGDKSVEAGTYTFFTIPNKDKWTVILNKEINLWGAYQHDKSKDIARFEVEPKPTAASVETFSITTKKADEGYHLLLGWDDTYIEIPVK